MNKLYAGILATLWWLVSGIFKTLYTIAYVVLSVLGQAIYALVLGLVFGILHAWRGWSDKYHIVYGRIVPQTCSICQRQGGRAVLWHTCCGAYAHDSCHTKKAEDQMRRDAMEAIKGTPFEGMRVVMPWEEDRKR